MNGLKSARRKVQRQDAGNFPGVSVWAIRILPLDRFSWIVTAMSAQEVIEQIKHMPQTERAQVAKFVVENDDSWIPEEFKQGMDDIAAGRVVDLDTALSEPYPGDK